MRIPRAALMALIIIINYVFQSTALQYASILGVIPDTTVILVVSYGMLRKEAEGAAFGFAAGLVHDMLGGYVIGVFALLGMVTGFVCGKPFKDFFHNHYFLPFFMVVAATVSNQLLIYCSSFLFLGKIDLSYYIRTIVLPKTIYTASVAVPVYGLVYAINSRLERFENKRRSFYGRS
ncbi:MAG: rod shape-determining protein MreD [Defluviitaleaceae bacterium]|nr:rod shape-determining protein MreD [Defluviitaleaceae bacterium]